YLYICSLLLILFLIFISDFKLKFSGNLKSIVFVCAFNVLSLLGVFFGVLWELSALGTSNPYQYGEIYGRHYFFSSIIFYVIFFNSCRKYMGFGSKILYWSYLLLLSFLLIL